MAICPFFGKCGGCKFDFTAANYRSAKVATLHKLPRCDDAVWVAPGMRRRADFCFAGGEFGFFERGSKNIIPVHSCPNLCAGINDIVPRLSKLPWVGSGSCLVTQCDNGIDVCVTSSVPYFPPEFRDAVMRMPVIRFTWNNRIIKQTVQPTITFDNVTVDYPSGAFLQPTVSGADALRDLVTSRARGYNRVADLFCGLGNFTYALNADGFDIVGTGAKRDLFKSPLTLGMLKNYDCVVMDPPRAGAMAQSKILAASNVGRIIYVSCNPETFLRDMEILAGGGYSLRESIPVDQFVGSHHWELFSVFDK